MQRIINLNKPSLFCIWHVIVSLKCCHACENCDKCKINWPLVPPCVSVPGSCGHRTLLWIIKSGGTCWHTMPGHHHLSPGAACQGGWWCQDATRVMWTQTHSLIFLAVFWCQNMWVCHATRDASSCIPLVLGTPGQKKGNEGQTENIRIIEISGKIFCVQTCHVSCVTRSGDDRHCHECHEVVSSKNKNTEGAQTLFRQHTTGIWGIIKLSQKDVLFVSMRHQTIR